MTNTSSPAASLKESTQYQACEKFFASREFRKLTKENINFKDFDRNNAEHLHALRDYLCPDCGKEFKDYQSLVFSYYQIGEALALREQYKEIAKQNQDRSLHHSPTATTGRYRRLGTYDAGIKLGVGHKKDWHPVGARG